MDLMDYLRVVRKRWRTILLTLLVTLGLAAAYLALAPKQYSAEAQLFVSTRGGGAEDSNQLLQGSTFTQQRVKSYAETVTAPIVLDPVIAKLGLDTTADDLAKTLEVTVPLDTVLIDISAKGKDPRQAAAVVNAISDQFRSTVPQLEGTGSGSAPVTITPLRAADVPDKPVSPKPLLVLAAATLLGLALAGVLALARELMDTSIQREQDVKDVTDEVVIGGLPFSRDVRKDPLVVHTHALSPRAEAFRTLRTNLQFVDAAHHARSIVFTSSLPGEGKSTTTANLALAMGESGSRVCVVEADLRRPRMIEYLGLAGGAGLTNLIIGDADLEDVLQPFGSSNVVALGAGPIPPNPSELLGSPAMQQVVRDLAERFDYVIYDAPPLLPVTDAAVLSRLVDGAVVVVGAGVVRKEQLRKTLELLHTVGAEVLGLVVNRLPAKGPDAYSYYREGYDQDPVHDPRAPRSSKKGTRDGRRKARTTR